MGFKGREGRGAGVWIVFDEKTDKPEPVLGVFATQEEARAFLDEQVPPDWGEVAYSHYEVGWSYFDGATRYRSR
jgi:hypothetical protein